MGEGKGLGELSRGELVNIITRVVKEYCVPAARDQAEQEASRVSMSAARAAVNERLEEISRLRWSVRLGRWAIFVRRHP